MVALNWDEISARVEYLYNKITRIQESKAIGTFDIAVQLHTTSDDYVLIKCDGIQTGGCCLETPTGPSVIYHVSQSCAYSIHLAIRQNILDQTTHNYNMANRQGYDVVVDVDAEVCARKI
jgi:hypothetical protein